jgi:hypothetical protein
LSSVFFILFSKILAPMSYNVPVVCDVLTAAIKKPRSGFSGGQNVPEKNRTKGRKPRLRFFVGQAAAGGAAHTTRYVPFARTPLFL